MISFQIGSFTDDEFLHSQKTLSTYLSKSLKTSKPFSDISMIGLRDNDHLRGEIYRTLPNFSSIICLANCATVKVSLEKLSGLPKESFCCVNLNIRLDFSEDRLKNEHNLGLHQDFHYSNIFVTPVKSYVLWAPLKKLSESVGGLEFVKDLSSIDGALPHQELKRGNNMNSRWSVNSPKYNDQLEELSLNEGEFLLFDMRHLHASSANKDPIFPRITLQARYSSFEEKGFLNYFKKLPVA